MLRRAPAITYQVIVSSTRNQGVSKGHKLVGHGLAVLQDLRLVRLEFGSASLLERNGQGADGVVVRSSLPFSNVFAYYSTASLHVAAQ